MSIAVSAFIQRAYANAQTSRLWRSYNASNSACREAEAERELRFPVFINPCPGPGGLPLRVAYKTGRAGGQILTGGHKTPCLRVGLFAATSTIAFPAPSHNHHEVI